MFQKLRSKLAELFQLDAAAELDFGIYRILNARRVEVEAFLDSLEPQVEAILAEALHTGTSELKAELAKTEADLRAMGLDDAAITAVPKVRELREKIATSGSDPTALTHDIFSHLTTFFSRYYKDGDFLSLRRYKRDTYAIPYEGEEVKLHWANADQYYIKSAETFRDYTFRLGPAPKDAATPDTRPTVTFKLVEADTQKDNTKATAGQERRFVYQGVLPASSSNLHPSSLILAFAYLPLGKDKKQAELNKQAIESILKDAAKGPFVALAAPDPSYTGKKKEGRTLLEKHLTDYTARNTFDYFIHKDLGGFLRRELDFYIKNEVLHLDDLDEAPETNWRETRARLKALRTIAGKVIRFLAQIEDFQKKLWLKKKFVTACDYVVTLDRIPEELYPEIAACDAQREEWVRLFAIDEITADLGRTGYSVPLTVEFLKENQGLPVDTSLLSKGLRIEVISRKSQVDGAENVVIKAENLGGLQCIQTAANRLVSCIYIDPPYNTGSDGFQYRDAYRHSSWISMIADRLHESRRLLNEEGSIFVSIDDNESANLRHALDLAYGAQNFVTNVIWHKMFSTKNTAQHFSESHDYISVYAMNGSSWQPKLIPRGADQDARYKNPDSDPRGPWTSGDLSARNYYSEGTYPITCPSGRLIEGPPPGMFWRVSATKFKQWDAEGRIWWGKDGNGVPRVKRFLSDVRDGLVPDTIWHHSDVGHTQEAKKTLVELYGPNFQQFTTPKPVALLIRILQLAVPSSQGILDFFAGSGTTGHAVINLNREDGGNRKYILIEMGEHFDTVLVPRLKKVIYSKDWKDGKPQSRNTGVSHCFKILRLESYEDTLNNLRLHRSRAQELALESMSAEAREDYQLGYMLDLEATGSQSLLNVSAFEDPFSYTLNIATGTAGETRPVTVDLVETFNWLIGLTVLAQGGSATSDKGGGVTWVEGTNPAGERVLVLWRNTKEVDADALNTWCRKQKVSVLDGEFSLIYINGDHHLENLRREDQTWKVRLIDEEFPKLMWEGC